MNNKIKTHANKKRQTVKLQTGRLEKCSDTVMGRGGADRFRKRGPDRKGKVQRENFSEFFLGLGRRRIRSLRDSRAACEERAFGSQ